MYIPCQVSKNSTASILEWCRSATACGSHGDFSDIESYMCIYIHIYMYIEWQEVNTHVQVQFIHLLTTWGNVSQNLSCTCYFTGLSNSMLLPRNSAGANNLLGTVKSISNTHELNNIIFDTKLCIPSRETRYSRVKGILRWVMPCICYNPLHNMKPQ